MVLLYSLSQQAVSGQVIDYSVSHLVGDKEDSARQFNQRFGFNAYTSHEDLINSPLFEIEGSNSFSLITDWYPGKGGFRFSAGLLYRPKAPADSSYKFSLADINLSSGLIQTSDAGMSHYVGFGWGSNLKQHAELDYSLDVGILYQPDRRIIDDYARQQETHQDFSQYMDSVDLSPIVSFGVSSSY